jgi:CGNR zinc finger
MKSHYALSLKIDYYAGPPLKVERRGHSVWAQVSIGLSGEFDLLRWKEPPHVALANLRTDDLGAFAAFTRRYGVIAWERHDAGNLGFSSGTVSASRALQFRDALRNAWKGELDTHELMWGKSETKNPDVPLARLEAHPGGLSVYVQELWALTRLMFLRDWFDGRTKVCASPDCPAPYFLAVRKGQRFCSQRCAVLVNVRRFRERQAKRQTLKSKRRTRSGEYAKAKKA